MAKEDEQELDFGDGVLPEEIEEIAVPMPLVRLEPWHRPRKQFIRERQWQRCAEMLLDRLIRVNSPSIRAGKIRYLTLPGVDYFDVELMGAVAARRELSLEAMGFLAGMAQEPVKARSQFRSEALIKKGLIVDTSVTYPYRFEELAAKGGQAYRSVKARAPFHIINVDACGSIALPGAQQAARIINALFSLVELQLDAMREPWLLYLTSDVREDHLSREVVNGLDRAIRQNAEESDEFRRGAVDALGVLGQGLEEALTSAEGIPGKFLTKFSLGFAKWLIHNARRHEWDVKCRPFFCYSTREQGEEGPSMPCLAFEFRPRRVNLRDVHGAIEEHRGDDEWDDGGEGQDYSMEALVRAREMVDVDRLFAEDDALAREFATKQRRLLEGAGYKEEALAVFDGRYMT